ncbi:MAG: hypothetical protein RLZZ44_1321 [Bacteroidota bacterium]
MSQLKTINLFCVDTVGGGGTEVWIRGLVKSLSRSYSVRLISCTLDQDLIRYVSNFIRIRAPLKPAFLRVIFFSIRSSFVPTNKKDFVHVIGASSFKKSDLNTIHFYHRQNFRLRKSSIYKHSSITKIINRTIYTILCAIMEKIIYSQIFSKKLASVSPEMCDLLEQDFCRLVNLTHNGVDPDELGKIVSRDKEIYLLFVGGDWERKGLFEVFNALERIRNIYPSLVLKVAGSGSRKKFDKFIDKANLYKNIEWLGKLPRNQIPYSEYSIVICASNFEVSPLVFLEAAMSGAPVISFPTFGTLEAVADGYLRICEPTVEALVEEITTLLSMPQLRANMSASGRLLKEKRNWEIMIRETLAFYPDNS